MTTKEDAALLDEILNEQDPVRLAQKIRDFYRDKDRADRTHRPYMYFHMGMLCGALQRLADQNKQVVH